MTNKVQLVWLCALTVSLCAVIAVLRYADRIDGPESNGPATDCIQDANELIEVGFTIVDNEGYEVAWFTCDGQHERKKDQ